MLLKQDWFNLDWFKQDVKYYVCLCTVKCVFVWEYNRKCLRPTVICTGQCYNDTEHALYVGRDAVPGYKVLPFICSHIRYVYTATRNSWHMCQNIFRILKMQMYLCYAVWINFGIFYNLILRVCAWFLWGVGGRWECLHVVFFII